MSRGASHPLPFTFLLASPRSFILSSTLSLCADQVLPLLWPLLLRDARGYHHGASRLSKGETLLYAYYPRILALQQLSHTSLHFFHFISLFTRRRISFHTMWFPPHSLTPHPHRSGAHLEQKRVFQNALHWHIEKVLQPKSLPAFYARLLQNLLRCWPLAHVHKLHK